MLRITTEVLNSRHTLSFPLGRLEPARSGDMQAVLFGQFSKCGDTPFRLEALEAPAFPAVLIPMATFKEIRRQFYQQLSEALAGFSGEQAAAARSDAMRAIRLHQAVSLRQGLKESLAVVIDQPRDWRFPLQNGADFTLLPLSKAAIHQLLSTLPRMRGAEDQLIWQIPFMLFDRDLPLYRDTISQLYQAGFRRFEVGNIGHFMLLRGLDGLHVSTWHRCFSLNSQALAAWGDMGAECATLYIEDDAVNLAELLAADIAIERRVVAYAPLQVMTTKIRLKDVHSNIPLHSDRGEGYSVTSRDGLQSITALTPFSLTARHNELRRMGCRSFLIDLRQAPREEWGEIMAAFRASRETVGTTEFNYATGLV